MDRPKTGTPGRRRLRSGSVRATELTGGHRVRIPEPSASPEQARERQHARPRPSVIDGPDALHGPGGAPDDQATVVFERLRAEATDTFAAVDVVERPPTRPSRTARVAQGVGLGIAVAALAGAVAIAAAVTEERAGHTAGDRPSAQITGERALLPNLLAEAYAETGRGARIEPPTSAAAERRAAPQVPGDRNSGSTSPAHSLQAGRPLLTPRDVVLEFHRLAPQDPAAAFDLLAGDALGTTADEFADAYRSVREVRVISVDDLDDHGTVLAVVVLTLDDGSLLRVRQALTVSGTTPQRITGAELLAIQSA